MNVVALLFSLCLAECLISGKSALCGSLFALSCFLLALLNPVLWLCLPLLFSLQYLYLSLREKRRLHFTAEARRRQGYREAVDMAYRLHLEQSLKNSL